jgi:hypothetical protein
MKFDRMHDVPHRKVAGKASPEPIILNSLTHPKEKKDAFYADAARFIDLMWQKIMPRVAKDSQDIILTAKKQDFLHKSIYKRYIELVTDIEEEFVRGIVSSMKAKNVGAVNFSPIEHAYACLHANGSMDYLVQPSARDGIKIAIYFAEVIFHKSRTYQEFEELLFSRSTLIFLKHLAANTKIASQTFEKMTSNNPRVTTLSPEFHFDHTKFRVSADGAISIDKSLMDRIKRQIIIENEKLGDNKIEDSRFCPALFAGTAMDQILNWILSEIARQYKHNWSMIKR